MNANWLSALGAVGGGSGGGGGGGSLYDISSSASSGPVTFSPAFGGFGGIQTGGTQGVSMTMLALIAGAVVLVAFVLKR